jgi:hypothetical protein
MEISLEGPIAAATAWQKLAPPPSRKERYRAFTIVSSHFLALCFIGQTYKQGKAAVTWQIRKLCRCQAKCIHPIRQVFQ